MFRRYLGYRLAVDARLARLYKAGLGDDEHRPFLRSSKAPFSPRDYTFLALVCSALMTSGQQILLSSLVADVEQAAAEAGIDLDQSTRAERLALVHALRQLIAWGALVEEDGSVAAYGEATTAQALLSVERDVAREVLARSLRDISGPSELIRTAAEVAPEALRHRVRRRLVECPVVLLADLAEPERLWLRQSQRREAQLLEDNFGLRLEIRAEGVAAFDPLDELTDVYFPREGTVGQAALLTVSALVDGVASTPQPPAPAAPVAPGAIEELTASLLERHRKSWAKDFAEHPARLAADVKELLTAAGLVVSDSGGGMLLRAVAARYAPEPTEGGAEALLVKAQSFLLETSYLEAQ